MAHVSVSFSQLYRGFLQPDGRYQLTFVLRTNYSVIGTSGSEAVFELGEMVTVGGSTIYAYDGYSSDGVFFHNVNDNVVYYATNTSGAGGQMRSLSASEAACFLEGTQIGCPDGERTVESLAIGDLVLDSEGRSRPVRWIGRHTLATMFTDERALPVRIRAGALGDAIPERDLCLSADHAVLMEGALVQAGAMINGDTIARVARVARATLAERFTYFHIELADHAAVLADGCPCESFVANVGRDRFDNFAEYVALFGEEQSIREMDYPRIKSARQLPASVRAIIARRGAARGDKGQAA